MTSWRQQKIAPWCGRWRQRTTSLDVMQKSWHIIHVSRLTYVLHWWVDWVHVMLIGTIITEVDSMWSDCILCVKHGGWWRKARHWVVLSQRSFGYQKLCMRMEFGRWTEEKLQIVVPRSLWNRRGSKITMMLEHNPLGECSSSDNKISDAGRWQEFVAAKMFLMHWGWQVLPKS